MVIHDLDDFRGTRILRNPPMASLSKKMSELAWCSQALQDDVDSISKLHQIVALCQRLQIHTAARRIGTEKQAPPAKQPLEKNNGHG